MEVENKYETQEVQQIKDTSSPQKDEEVSQDQNFSSMTNPNEPIDHTKHPNSCNLALNKPKTQPTLVDEVETTSTKQEIDLIK